MSSFIRTRRWLSLGLLLPLWGCLPTAKSPKPTTVRTASTRSASSRTASTGAGDFARDMVTAHNTARAQARPAPRPALPPLAWSDEAARKAASWAKHCRFEHNPDRGDFGENLAAATPGAWTTPEVVKSWADEAVDYDAARNTCRKGKVCGHYTQVVWRATRAVGCVTVMCNRNSPFGPQAPEWQLWVCNYAPPGNWVDQRPY